MKKKVHVSRNYWARVDVRATGPVLTSDKEEKPDILPTTLNFTVRRGKLRIKILQTPLKVIWKFSPLLWLQRLCCGMFSLDGEVVFIHSKHEIKIGSSTLFLVVTGG